MPNQDDIPQLSAVDEGERPKAPELSEATDAHREKGGRLGEIHKMHLQEMGYLRKMIDEAERAAHKSGGVGRLIARMQLSQNLRSAGGLASRTCNALIDLHTAEVSELFSALDEKGDAGVDKVLLRLRGEHKVIGKLLSKFEKIAFDLHNAPSEEGLDALDQIFKEIEDTLANHFAYEEEVLTEALGFYEVV